MIIGKWIGWICLNLFIILLLQNKIAKLEWFNEKRFHKRLGALLPILAFLHGKTMAIRPDRIGILLLISLSLCALSYIGKSVNPYYRKIFHLIFIITSTIIQILHLLSIH